MVAQAFNPSTWETEVGRSLSSRPASSIEPVSGLLGIHRRSLSPKTKSWGGGVRGGRERAREKLNETGRRAMQF